MPKYNKIDVQDFQSKLSSAGTEISSVALGGQVISCSDDFFADVSNLLKVEPATSMKGQFGPKGALFDGWESKRHNPTFDWAILKLGAPGHLIGFDIDTANFNGNEAPEASVEAMFSVNGVPDEKSAEWTEVLPRVSLGPSSRHLFRIDETDASYTHVKLNMYPDGGIARFRVYGLVSPIFPASSESIDLAHVLSGGRVVFTSDQHFGVGPNLLLPGRGKDMGDGWETRRSREPGHKDFTVIRLGAPGYLAQVEIDTAHFKGNFPESCDLCATNSGDILPSSSATWTPILSRIKLSAHHQHVFNLENVSDRVYTHVRLTIYPDGGVKRVRVIGKRAGEKVESVEVQRHGPTAVTGGAGGPPSGHAHHYVSSAELALANELSGNGTEPPTPSAPLPSKSIQPVLRAVPLSQDAYAPYGDVIQAYVPTSSAPASVRVTSANQGSAYKFHRLARIVSSYPSTASAVPAISVFRSTPVGATPGQDWPVKILERHPHTNQTFIPMGTGGDLGTMNGARLEKPGRAYLAIVALNGQDDKPDLNTLRAFVATTAQGISYHTGVWHHPMISLETTIDFACVETQIGEAENAMDCEVLELAAVGMDIPAVTVPPL